jgi:molybdate transport system ATP-binding protein
MAVEVDGLERMSIAEQNVASLHSASRALTLSVSIRKRLSAPGRDFLLDIECDAGPGITILFGASGAGKTTLLDCIAGLTTPDAGRITIGNRVFFNSDQSTSLPVQKRGIGFVFQDLALFPHLTAEKNIAYGLAELDRRERRKRVHAIVDSFHISHLRHQKPREISGGERQRVALARALITDPCLLLLDEPLAALDGATKSKIIDDLRAWNRAHGIPILYVTHSREEVFALGERVLALENGRLVAQGTPHEVMTAPRHETVAQLAGFENIFDVVVTAAHEDRGTMTCQIIGSKVELETPLVSVYERAGDKLEIAKSADKDCFYLLGRTLEWKQLADAAELKDELAAMVREFDVPPQYIRELCGIYRETRRAPGARRTERPWRFHRRLLRILGSSRSRDFQKARASLIADLVGKNPVNLKLRPSGRVALEWARLSTEGPADS